MHLDEWKQLCREAWQKDYDSLQIDRFAKIGQDRYTVRNCNKNTYKKAIPETKLFKFLYINKIYAINNNDDLEDLDDLDELQSKVKQNRLVEKLGKQGYRYDVKELLEQLTAAKKDTSVYKTKTITESFTKNNKTLFFIYFICLLFYKIIKKLNGEVLELMNVKGMIAP